MKKEAYKIREGGKLITKWSISLLLLFCPLITFNFAPLKCCGCQKLGELLCALQNLWIETLKDWRRRREGRRNFATQSSIRFSSFRIIIFSSCYYGVVLIKSAYAIAAEKRVINNLAKQRKMWQNNWLPRWRSYFDVEEIKTVIEMSFFVSFFIFFFGGHYPPTPCFFPTIKGYFSFL